jgi:hypothetical protein
LTIGANGDLGNTPSTFLKKEQKKTQLELVKKRIGEKLTGGVRPHCKIIIIVIVVITSKNARMHHPPAQ